MKEDDVADSIVAKIPTLKNPGGDLMKRHLLVTALVLSVVLVGSNLTSTAAADVPRDGHWWRDQDRLTRIRYLTGFFDGMDLGHKFSYWKFESDEKMEPCIWKVVEAYNEYSAKYFNTLTNIQIMEGLDSFYVDSRNRKILVTNAVWIVLNTLTGTPQDKLDMMVENWRQSADRRMLLP